MCKALHITKALALSLLSSSARRLISQKPTSYGRSAVAEQGQADIVGYSFFLLARGMATSRAHSMKSCTVGLRMRFFIATIATGLRVVGKSMGKALIAGSPNVNRKTDSGTIVRNRPFATRAMRARLVEVTTLVRGRSRPTWRNASVKSEPYPLLGAGSVQGSSITSASAILRLLASGFPTP